MNNKFDLSISLEQYIREVLGYRNDELVNFIMSRTTQDEFYLVKKKMLSDNSLDELRSYDLLLAKLTWRALVKKEVEKHFLVPQGIPPQMREQVYLEAYNAIKNNDIYAQIGTYSPVAQKFGGVFLIRLTAAGVPPLIEHIKVLKEMQSDKATLYAYDRKAMKNISSVSGNKSIVVPPENYDKLKAKYPSKSIIKGNYSKNQINQAYSAFSLKSKNFKSLGIDAKNATHSAWTSFLISSLIAYAVLRENGVSPEDALKQSVQEIGYTSAFVAFSSGLITFQLNRTDYVKKSKVLNRIGKLGDGRIGKAMGNAYKTTGSQLLKNNATSAAVAAGSIVVARSFDFVRGKISGSQFARDAIKAVAIVPMTYTGWLGGAALGAKAGAPICGPLLAPGGLPGFFCELGFFTGGAVVGAMALGTSSEYVLDKALDKIIPSDRQKMLDIIIEELNKKIEPIYNENNIEQINELIDIFISKLTPSMIVEMYVSRDRSKYAQNLIHKFIGENLDSMMYEHLVNLAEITHQEQEIDFLARKR